MNCNRCHTELEYIFQELWFCSICKECLGESEALHLSKTTGESCDKNQDFALRQEIKKAPITINQQWEPK